MENFRSRTPAELPNVNVAICAEWVGEGRGWMGNSRRGSVGSLAGFPDRAEAGVGEVGLAVEGCTVTEMEWPGGLFSSLCCGVKSCL